MKNKILLFLIIAIAFLGGMFVSKGFDIIKPSFWIKSSTVSQPNQQDIINSPQSYQQYTPKGGGMWHSPMNPSYNPQYDWYTPPKKQYKNSEGYWCW